jgi:virginiamycin B lyase
MQTRRLLQILIAGFAVILFPPSSQLAAQGASPAALTGQVTSEAEGAMEGVVVSAKKAGSTVTVSVISDAQGRYRFPANRLGAGNYSIKIRAVGYDLAAPATADVAEEQTTTVDLKLRKAKNLVSQMSNAEWMMSLPGSEEDKAFLLGCVGCHTLERIVRSTHDADVWTQVIVRMNGYGPVSQPIKPQRMLDPERSGTPEQFRKQAEYLAKVNLSEASQWEYPLKTLPRPTGRATRAIITEYAMPRPTTEPHDVLVDAQGTVWYSDFGELFISKFDPKTLKLTEYPVKEFKPGAPVGNLSLEFDKRGTLWFDTMFQGALGTLDPKTGEIKYYPLGAEYNDNRVQLNFVGLRHDVDGKVWTKSVGTQDVFRLDLATGNGSASSRSRS